MGNYAGKQIVIKYYAELLSSAVTTTAGNPNIAKLVYSNKILPDSEEEDNPNKPENPGKNTIEDEATVYTFQITIVKKKDTVNGDALAKVVFDLYKYNGTQTGPSEEELKTNGERIKDNLTTDKNGIISVPGLANGDYYLVETKTVDGYNLLTAPVKVTLSIQYTTHFETSTKWSSDGTLLKTEIVSTKTTFSGNDGEDLKLGNHTETIVNKKGFTLPVTGGMGTVIFSVLGIALVLAGLLVITASRKKAAK